MSLWHPYGNAHYAFSIRSEERLATCHADLQQLFREVIKHTDCTILEGHRDQQAQDEYFAAGRSKLQWPNSRHNVLPSKAVDVIPHPFKTEDWNNIGRFAMFAGVVLGIATKLGIPIRCGIDWNRNLDPSDNWVDAPHFELWEG